METFSILLAICAGNSPVTGEFPTQRPVTWSFVVVFDLRLNKRLSKNGEAGDLRRNRDIYDVTVMLLDFVRQIHQSPEDSPSKGPVMRILNMEFLLLAPYSGVAGDIWPDMHITVTYLYNRPKFKLL